MKKYSFLVLAAFFVNRSECSKIETYSEKSQKQMRCFDFHKIFLQDVLPSVPNTSALGFASVPGSGALKAQI
jgi:hypothetical protein